MPFALDDFDAALRAMLTTKAASPGRPPIPNQDVQGDILSYDGYYALTSELLEDGIALHQFHWIQERGYEHWRWGLSFYLSHSELERIFTKYLLWKKGGATMDRQQFYESVTELAANEINTGAVGDPDRKATVNMAVVGHILRVALERMKHMTFDEVASLIHGD